MKPTNMAPGQIWRYRDAHNRDYGGAFVVLVESVQTDGLVAVRVLHDSAVGYPAGLKIDRWCITRDTYERIS